MAWCSTWSSHGFLFLLQRVRKDVDRGTQHSDMFLLKAEEGREGMCTVPGQATWAAMCRWEAGRGFGAGGEPLHVPPREASRHLANGSHVPSGAPRMQS